MSESNTQLVGSIIGGEHHRFAEVVRQFDQGVRNAIAKRIQDPATIEDLTQETFYKAFRNLEHLQDPAQLPSWLTTIARNCVSDHFRRQIRREEKEQSGGIQSALRSHSLQSARDNWIWDEVDQLPDGFSQVLKFRYQMSCTYQEIAKRMNLSESTVRGRIYEARKALRNRLNERGLF